MSLVVGVTSHRMIIYAGKKGVNGCSLLFCKLLLLLLQLNTISLVANFLDRRKIAVYSENWKIEPRLD